MQSIQLQFADSTTATTESQPPALSDSFALETMTLCSFAAYTERSLERNLLSAQLHDTVA